MDFLSAKRRLTIPLLSQLPKMSVAEIQAALMKQKELAKLGVQVDALHEAVMQRRNTLSGANVGCVNAACAKSGEVASKKRQETQVIEVSESSTESSFERSKHP